MSFLENMLSGMIKESTGYDTRRLVRRIGGGKLLLAGGAALAGALIAEQVSKRSGAGAAATPPATATVPPPLPPLPTSPTSQPPQATAQGLPPLPPLPTTVAAPSPPTATEPPPLLFAVVRTMAAAALADGELRPEEREAIEGRLGESGLTEEQIRRIRKDLILPPGPRELAALVADLALPDADAVEARETLFRAAAAVLRADQEVTAPEEAWLGTLAVALGVTPERRAELTRGVFG